MPHRVQNAASDAASILRRQTRGSAGMNFKEINNALGTMEGYALVKSCDKKVSKNGSTYLDLVLADKTDEVSAKFWDYKEGQGDEIEANIIVKVRGQMQTYNRQPQFRVERIRRVTEQDRINYEDFVPSSDYSGDFLLGQLDRVVDALTDPELRGLVAAIVEEYRDRIRDLPAAYRLHHAIRGGLLTHTLSIVRMAQTVAALYPTVDKDLLIAGAILHDIAKTEEFTVSLSGLVSGYSTRGELLGHLVMGAMIVERVGTRIGANRDVMMYLEHMLLSHHGEPEFGAAVRPLFLEAEILAQLDVLDARIYEIENAVQNVESGSFSTRQWALEDRKFYNHGRRLPSTEVKLD